MTEQEFLNKFIGIKQVSTDKYDAACPVCGDTNSRHLSIRIVNGTDSLTKEPIRKALLNCNKCSSDPVHVSLILSHYGMTEKDMFFREESSVVRAKLKTAAKPKGMTGEEFINYLRNKADKDGFLVDKVRRHNYTDTEGKLLCIKVIMPPKDPEGKKYVAWIHPDSDKRFVFGQEEGVVTPLFNAKELSEKYNEDLFFSEGEKDAGTLQAMGYLATTAPNGGNQTTWDPSWNALVSGRKNVYILTDNDSTGEKYGAFIAEHAAALGCRTYIIPATSIYADVEKKGDITDIFEKVGDSECRERLNAALQIAIDHPVVSKKTDPMLALFKPLSDYEERDPEWLVKGLIPKGQITMIAGDGGTGKSGILATLSAAITTGKPCLLDPEGATREVGTVMLCSAEDSIRARTKRRLRIAGANMDRVVMPDFGKDPDRILDEFKFGTKSMRNVIEEIKPTLCIFDPIQSFVPADINMGSRNAMRQCMQPLVALGETYGTTFIILAHTNKRQNASGRDRISDSADLWDICRSVFITGMTDRPGVRYVSNEKNSYADLAPTILFEVVDEGQLVYVGESYQRDSDYQSSKAFDRIPSNRESCADDIIAMLASQCIESKYANTTMKSQDLDSKLLAMGYSPTAIRRAKESLKKNDDIFYKKENDGWSIGASSKRVSKWEREHHEVF